MGSSLAWELLRTALALGLLCAAAFFGLRFLVGRGLLGAPPAETGPELRVLRRLTLGPRSRVFVVAVGERTLVLGVGDSGAPRLLADLGERAQPAQGEARDG